MRVFGYIRLLPLLVIVAMLSFAVRVGDFMHELSHSGTAFAQQEVHAEMPPLPAPASESKKTGDQAVNGDPAPFAAADETEGERIDPADWRDAGDSAFEYSEVQASLYKDLVERRKLLDKREKEIAMREALLEAGERELDQKLREMTAIRNEIEGLLKTQSDEERARIESLVKIYEGMKAKDAAAIFNTLEMDVLIRIMGRMSERKSGPILAEMNPERARSVTILLAEQRKLPALAGN